LQDTLKAKRLDGEQNNLPIESSDEAPVRSQITTYEWLKNKEGNKEAEKTDSHLTSNRTGS
jgi:hypothetical protein